jgi:hypothetical protein
MENQVDFREATREDYLGESFLQLNLFKDGRTSYQLVYENSCRHYLMILSQIFHEAMQEYLE